MSQKFRSAPERENSIKASEGGTALVRELILSDVLPWSGSILFYLLGECATCKADKWVQCTLWRTTSLTLRSFTAIDFPPMQAPYPQGQRQGLANDSFKHFCTYLAINLLGTSPEFFMSENVPFYLCLLPKLRHYLLFIKFNCISSLVTVCNMNKNLFYICCVSALCLLDGFQPDRNTIRWRNKTQKLHCVI